MSQSEGCPRFLRQMKIINQTKNTILAEETITANGFFSRMKGLLGKKELSKGHAIILTPCNCIHTLFMRFAIDVLFVGKDNNILELINTLKPFRVSPPYYLAKFVIELPAGTIQSTATQKGDSLSFD